MQDVYSCAVAVNLLPSTNLVDGQVSKLYFGSKDSCLDMKLSAITSPAVAIGFEQTTYIVGEGEVVEVCAVVTSGTLDRDAFVRLSSVDDEAVGKPVNANLVTIVCNFTYPSTQLA